MATLVSQVEDERHANASSESQEEESSVRFDDFAASNDCGVEVVFVEDTAVVLALVLFATTAQEIVGTRNVRVRVATVGVGDLDCVSLVAQS